jgi:hypothetical protein
MRSFSSHCGFPAPTAASFHLSQTQCTQSVRRLRLAHALANWRAFASHSLQRETQRRLALRFYYCSRLSAALRHWRAALATLTEHRITLDNVLVCEFERPRLRGTFFHWLTMVRRAQQCRRDELVAAMRYRRRCVSAAWQRWRERVEERVAAATSERAAQRYATMAVVRAVCAGALVCCFHCLNS